MYPLAQGRKASHDGSDTTLTSITEVEFKKAGPGILKSTKRSIKRKAQSLSQDADDTVIEPLLQKEKDDSINKCAKSIFTKSFAKTEDKKDCLNENDTKRNIDAGKTNGDCYDQRKPQHVIEKPDVTVKSDYMIKFSDNSTKSTINSSTFADDMRNANYITENNSISRIKTPSTVSNDKSKIIQHTDLDLMSTNDTSKQISPANTFKNDPSPLIFTTAKIHVDGNSVQPYQVNAVPITSVTEKRLTEKTPDTSNNTIVQQACSDYKPLSSFASINSECPKNKNSKCITEKIKDKASTSQLESFKEDITAKKLPVDIEFNLKCTTLNNNVKSTTGSVKTTIGSIKHAQEISDISNNTKFGSDQSDIVPESSLKKFQSTVSSGPSIDREEENKKCMKSFKNNELKESKQDIITKKATQHNGSKEKVMQDVVTINVTESYISPFSSQFKGDLKHHNPEKEIKEDVKEINTSSECNIETIRHFNAVKKKSSDSNTFSASKNVTNIKQKETTHTKEHSKDKNSSGLEFNQPVNNKNTTEKDKKLLDKAQPIKQTINLSTIESSMAENADCSDKSVNTKPESDKALTKQGTSTLAKDTLPDRSDGKSERVLESASARNISLKDAPANKIPQNIKENPKPPQTGSKEGAVKKHESTSSNKEEDKNQKECLTNKPKEAKSLESKIAIGKGLPVKTESVSSGVVKKVETDNITGTRSKQVTEVKQHDSNKTKNNAANGKGLIIGKSATTNSSKTLPDQ